MRLTVSDFCLTVSVTRQFLSCFMPNDTKFTKGDPRINRKGRPPVGLSFADKVRAVVGKNGDKLVEMWAAIAYGHIPHDDGDTSSSRALYIAKLNQLMAEAEMHDRLTASRMLADRGFGRPKETVEHSGEIAARTTVIHEYHSS